MANQDPRAPVTVLTEPEILPCGPCPVRELAVCGALAPDELYALAEIVREVNYAPQKSVFHEGDAASSFFIITSGVASVGKLLPDSRRQIAGFLYPADFCGLTLGGHYTSTVTAVTNLSLCRLPRGPYEALLRRYQKLESRLLGKASDELAVAQDQMVLLGRKTAVQKLGSFLLIISERAGRGGQLDNPLWLPMSRDDISDYLGLTLETTSRMFSQLERLGAISRLSDVKIDLVDRQLLHEIAGGE